MSEDIKNLKKLISLLNEIVDLAEMLETLEQNGDISCLRFDTVFNHYPTAGISIPNTDRHKNFISTMINALKVEKSDLQDEFIKQAKETIPLFEQCYDGTTAAPSWIYKSPSDHLSSFTPEFWEDLEKALGFKLFYWQKTMITLGECRGYGETTAKVLRNLLVGNLNKPFIMYDPPDYLKKLYEDIHKKLEKAKIPCRNIEYRCRRSQALN